MLENFTPKLTTFDWNDEWKDIQRLRRRPDNAAFWDERAKTFTTKDTPNPYVTRFLELAKPQPNDTVFDMGCGTGSLSIPLAERGHKVLAADFSKGMLDILEAEVLSRGIKGVETKQMSWSDNWEDYGVMPKMMDVAYASRSIATADLKDSLMRLDAVARKRACITLATSASARLDEQMLSDLGLPNPKGHDFPYAFMILLNEGVFPEVSYIASERTETFDTLDEAYEILARMVKSAVGEQATPHERAVALANLRTWLQDKLQKNKRAGMPDKKGIPEKALRLPSTRQISWAFIAWNTRTQLRDSLPAGPKMVDLMGPHIIK